MQTYKCNDISINATYLHVIDNEVSTNYDGFFVIISYLDEHFLLVQNSNNH